MYPVIDTTNKAFCKIIGVKITKIPGAFPIATDSMTSFVDQQSVTISVDCGVRKSDSTSLSFNKLQLNYVLFL